MYELSALLCGIGKECSSAFKKKIIMSGYRNTSVNTDFYWLTTRGFSEYRSSVKLLPRFSLIFQEFQEKLSHTFFLSFLQVL